LRPRVDEGTRRRQLAAPPAAPPTGGYALVLEQVGKNFGDVVAVRDVSLAVSEGEFMSILGPSGCGKSTLLRLIAGFLRPSSGQIVILGRNSNDIPAHRRPTNMVFQQLALFPHLTVYGNVAFGLRIKRRSRSETRDAVMSALAQVDLAGYENRWPKQLSGGQQQRVAIARALVNRPAALLLDEPLGALDLRLRRHLQAQLRSLNRLTGTTFVYVTHDQEEAMAMSDRIAVMEAGRIEQVGSPAEIYTRPVNRHVAEFVGETNLLEGSVAGRDADEVRVTVRGHSLRLPGHEIGQGTEAVAISLRPEALRLGGGPVGACSCRGVIRETSYLGSSIRYLVECPLSDNLIVRAQTPAEIHPVGSQVTIQWDTGNMVVLASSPDARR
jgi:spermidine/putrescine transport system ATP-binding protein